MSCAAALIDAAHVANLASTGEVNLRSSTLTDCAVSALVELLQSAAPSRMDLRRCQGLTPEDAQRLQDAAPASTKLLLDAGLAGLPFTGSASTANVLTAPPSPKLAVSASAPSLAAPPPAKAPAPAPAPAPGRGGYCRWWRRPRVARAASAESDDDDLERSSGGLSADASETGSDVEREGV